MSAARDCQVMFALMAPVLAVAGSGQIDSFGANATSVIEGSTVDFFASVSVNTTTIIDGGSDLNEPAPLEGTQFWILNWYRAEQETIREVSLYAGGQTFVDLPSTPGSGYSGSWNFSVLYPSPGNYAVELSGSWLGEVSVYYSSEMATRDCYYVDPGGINALECSSWIYTYNDNTNTYSTGGGFSSQTINIEVLAAPVPEPSAFLLLACGLLPVAARARKGNRAPRA